MIWKIQNGENRFDDGKHSDRPAKSVQDRTAFNDLSDYVRLCLAFLTFIEQDEPTRIISPSHHNYIFYQYGESYGHKITRPLNTELFIASSTNFQNLFERFITLLDELKKYCELAIERQSVKNCIELKEVNKVVYTIQQSIGSIGDSFDNIQQSRKRIGQLFEKLVKLILNQVGLECEPRTITIPIPGYPGYRMSYELDLVFSRNKAILSSETEFIHQSEIVGSVKTTSKDRIDKIFLDKYLLTKLLGRNIPVVAIFLHDVQRATRGNSIRTFAQR